MIPYGPNDIILVNPTPGGGWDTMTDGRYFFPIGLLYLQGYLHKHGIPSRIIDTMPDALSPDAFKTRIRDLQPKVIGFTGSPFERHALHEYIRGIKEFAPDALVVAGGPYFTATARECLEHLSDVDVVVQGEGEGALLELVETYAAGEDLGCLAGITYRDSEGRIRQNAERPPQNRDECEYDISLIPNDDTYSPYVVLKNFEAEKRLALPVLLARGCTKRCTFCFNNSARFRSRSVKSILEEIQRKREALQCDHFWMVDPTFTLREKFARELCHGLIEHCPGIKWYCETRADCNLELLELMARAGCISIDFALESGSPRVLAAIKKDLDVFHVLKFARRCKKLSIRALVFVMYSLPEETYADFRQTMEVLTQIRPYIYDISIGSALILPGTEMEKQARAKGILPADFSWYDPRYRHVPAWKSHMSDAEIRECANALNEYRFVLKHSRLELLRKRMAERVIGWGKQLPLMNATNPLGTVTKTNGGASNRMGQATAPHECDETRAGFASCLAVVRAQTSA